MNDVLARWNNLLATEAAEEILPCCGSKAWAREVAKQRPLPEETALIGACDKVWWGLDQADWLEAFCSHPRIGESKAHLGSARSSKWSGEEQRRVGTADEAVKAALAEANQVYEERFHRTFIICASNKSAEEILGILRARLENDEAMELREAAEQQRQITHIRLKKWLHP
jgi:2-oxo-4-hydroxy-4-carboxy-5-ureidoimidazoline decarboxylase